ncbi:hypothetical protein [Brevibacillus laterosporus]|uniref:Uncharacterized protein n=1 Tax=Brevibacillus laterosporus TaxID=1465 RepID=A0AAP3DKW5_BRELA|nr:hypothetical protein [Brevibacillus laterosporus]MCR8982807.1 hypothetical protein [Brevibacillus laterosporus]MCZ0809963.1 hypothetical protein [Brevibacillus laterosporus]MCZ0828589.1 hypothetical protein [Brevibacillus laterosporus]MCZ0852553.1 hypothetical protein [Brevibacillus laterosporus]
MFNRNFTNVNEVFPIIDLIRREMKKGGLYDGGDDLTIVQSRSEPEVVSVEVLREMTSHPSLVTTVIYTYDNGAIEKLSLERDESLMITGFLIEVELSSIVNEELEEETDIQAFKAIQGSIIRENGLFKSLQLDYVRAV